MMTAFRRLRLVALCSFVACVPPTSQVPPRAAVLAGPAKADELLGRKLDAYVASFGRQWGEGYAASAYVLVARHGVPVLKRAYGKANREKAIVADENTRFRIGSLTKQFTAVAVLQLLEAGKVNLNAPLRQYLPSYPAASGDKVTILQLLAQTSGLANYTDDEALMASIARPRTQDEIVASFASKPLAFEPGSSWAYSNSNYFLLGMVIERVAGMTYEAYLQRHVLGPAKMTRTSTVELLDASGDAKGYEAAPDGKAIVAEHVDMSVPFAAGALRSTAADLLRWEQALYRSTALVDEASRARMLTPGREDYGFGIITVTRESHVLHFHTGGINGFSSVLVHVDDDDVDIIVLSNNQDFTASNVSKAVLRLLYNGETPPPRDESKAPEPKG